MAKAKIKTTQNDASVEAFLESLEDERQREDSYKIDAIMQRITGQKPKMWGGAIVGYGERHIVSASRREVDWMIIGFSPRKGKFSLYISVGQMEGYDKLLAKLGKHKTGMGCLYVNKLADVDEAVLEKLIAASFKNNKV